MRHLRNKVKDLDERLLSEMEAQNRFKDKIYFQMFINIRNRYRKCPEKLIKIYQLHFNKVPPFKDRLENYKEEDFLFTFEEFKSDFREIINTHENCGEMCIHL